MTEPAGLPVRRLLRLAAGQRIVFQSVVQDELAVARVLFCPIALELDGAVRAAITGRAPASALPPEVVPLLEACAARSSLGILPGVPDLIAGGVAPLALPGRGLPPPGQGYVHVSSRWIEGARLTDAPELDTGDKLQFLAALGRTLERIHGGFVVYGRVRPNGIILAAGTPWLVELEGFARVSAGDARLAEDVLRYGELGAWLLESELSRAQPEPELQAWRTALDACRREPAAARPTMAQLLDWLGLMAPGDAAGETIAVADPTLFARRAPAAPLDPPTELVPDPDPPLRAAQPDHEPSPWGVVLFAVLLLGMAVAIGFALR
jgi:hypothetical protein